MDKVNNQTLFYLFLAVIVCFGAGYGAPWYLDDVTSIYNRTELHTDGAFIEIVKDFAPRWVVDFTYALQYEFHLNQPQHFRVFNWLFHLLNGGLLLLLLRSFCQDKRQFELSSVAVVFILGIFLLHPLQIQSVTYVVQRYNLIATLFVLLSIYSYLKFRYGLRWSRAGWATATIIFLVLGYFSKQNAVVAILLIGLVEWAAVRSFRLKIPYAILTLLIGSLAISLLFWGPDFIQRLTRETDDITRLQYLTYQVAALADYQFKFIFPLNLHLEYNRAQLEHGALVTGLLYLWHGLLICGAVLLRNRIPLISFGILWFYFAHGVESSLIPISDVAFEHRNYLPMIGMAFVMVGIFKALGLTEEKSKKSWSVYGVLIVLGILTYMRNSVWADEVRFYDNELQYSQQSLRVMQKVANLRFESGDIDGAIKIYESLPSRDDFKLTEAHIINLSAMYIAAGRYDEAENLLSELTPHYQRIHVAYKGRFNFLNGRIAYLRDDNCKKAIEYFNEVQLLFEGERQSNLGILRCQIELGNEQQANQMLKKLYIQGDEDSEELMKLYRERFD